MLGRLVQEYPQRAVSWFAVGCYYMCTRQYEAARRYFGRATTVDPNFAPAWVGFGNAFALQDESDQVCPGDLLWLARFELIRALLTEALRAQDCAIMVTLRTVQIVLVGRVQAVSSISCMQPCCTSAPDSALMPGRQR